MWKSIRGVNDNNRYPVTPMTTSGQKENKQNIENKNEKKIIDISRDKLPRWLKKGKLKREMNLFSQQQKTMPSEPVTWYHQ